MNLIFSVFRRWFYAIIPYMMTKYDFSFLDRDIERQRELAREAIKYVKELDDLIEKVEEGSEKQALMGARKSLLYIARQLADNANTTSSTAITVISTATSTSI